MDSESNFDSEIHGAKYVEFNENQLERELAKQEKKNKQLNALLKQR